MNTSGERSGETILGRFVAEADKVDVAIPINEYIYLSKDMGGDRVNPTRYDAGCCQTTE